MKKIKQNKTKQDKTTQNQHRDLQERHTAVRMNYGERREIMTALGFCD